MTELYDDDQQEYTERFPPERGRKMGCLTGAFLGVIFAVLLVAGGGFLFYQRQVDPPGSAGAEVNVSIPLGSSTQRIATILETEGVIENARFFRLYTRVNGEGPFQAGEYKIRKKESFSNIVEILDKGPELKFVRLTVQEGLTLKEIAAKVATLEGKSGEKFLELASSGQVRSKYQPAGSNNLEGLLLPETYNFEEKDDELAILKRMVEAFDATCDQLGCANAKAKVGLDPYQVAIVASLIEEETRFDDERAKVAQVVYNRLERGEILAIDATVIYALGKSGELKRVLTADLQVQSPYNTYKVRGLPPTPIAGSGRASIEAALNPEKGDLMFYVVTEADGRHTFARTLAEHNANIRKAEANGVR